MKVIVFFYVHGLKVYQFNVKDSKIKPCPLHLGNVSKDFTAANIEKTHLNGKVCDFSVDYDTNFICDIVDIHKYLMKKHNIK